MQPFDPCSSSNVTLIPDHGTQQTFGDSATTQQSGKSGIHSYDVIEEIGRGGMGVVYRARQTQANRNVALKLVLSGINANPIELGRFRTEAEAISRLQHPNVVCVFEVGNINGNPFYSMELCSGGSLAKPKYIGSFDPTKAATFIRKVALGLAAAHDAGVIHRDIKPGNILLTADGEPKLADFGLAKCIKTDSDDSLTTTGAILGTPSYMAPEQAAGLREIGPAADIYSLGAVLYELLTNQPPFKTSSITETILAVITEEPLRPTALRTRIPRDLEAVVLCCLEKNPAKRYSTAAALAEDLQRFLDGDPVLAVRSSLVGRFSAEIKRVQPHAMLGSYVWLPFAFAPVMLLPEILATIAHANEWPSIVVLCGRLVQAMVFIGIFASFRGKDIWPRGPVERQLFAVWGGYFLACFGYGLTGFLMMESGGQPEKFYPGFACLTSLAFFSISANFWGYCGFIGAGFLLLAFLMLIFIPLAPLAFGFVWAIALILIGLRLRQISLKA